MRRYVCAATTPRPVPADRQCVAATTACTGTQGYNASARVCIASPTDEAQCRAISKVRLSGGNCATMCGMNNAPTSSSNRQCVAATTACSSGAQGYNSSTRTCIAAGSVNAATQCAVFAGATGKNLFQSGTGCVTASACRTGSRAVSGSTCITGTAMACFNDGGRGFSSGTGCVDASMASCMAGNYDFSGGMCIARLTCTGGMPIVNSAGDDCVATCAAGEGLSAMSGAGRRCIAAATASAQQCVNNGSIRLAAGGCAAMCGVATNAPNASGQCQAATTACTTAQGFNASTRVCVSSPNVAQCQAVMRVLEGSSCATLCDANNAPDNTGECDTATTVCDTTDGYDSTDRVCVTSGQTAAECQALSMRVLEGSSCATLCDANRAPDSDGACGTATAMSVMQRMAMTAQTGCV